MVVIKAVSAALGHDLFLMFTGSFDLSMADLAVASSRKASPTPRVLKNYSHWI